MPASHAVNLGRPKLPRGRFVRPFFTARKPSFFWRACRLLVSATKSERVSVGLDIEPASLRRSLCAKNYRTVESGRPFLPHAAREVKKGARRTEASTAKAGFSRNLLFFLVSWQARQSKVPHLSLSLFSSDFVVQLRTTKGSCQGAHVRSGLIRSMLESVSSSDH